MYIPSTNHVLSCTSNSQITMFSKYQFFLIIYIILFSNCINSSSIYSILEDHGLPMGLLPKGVKDFTLDEDGNFHVHLDQPCNAKFENEIHYETNVSGSLSYGQIWDLSGIAAQDLFLWFPVKEIRVDIPPSGLIYFDVGVVSKQFSLSSFETPRDCVAGEVLDLQVQNGKYIVAALSKSQTSKLEYKSIENKASVKAIL